MNKYLPCDEHQIVFLIQLKTGEVLFLFIINVEHLSLELISILFFNSTILFTVVVACIIALNSSNFGRLLLLHVRAIEIQNLFNTVNVQHDRISHQRIGITSSISFPGTVFRAHCLIVHNIKKIAEI